MWPSMIFRLISSDNKDATASSYFNVDWVVLPIATTRLSQESGKDHNKVIHLSSSAIVILTETSWLTKVLKAFRCSVTKSPSCILRWYNFFQRNNLFSRDFDWYKFPNLSHSSLAVDSPETFNRTESTRQSRIVLLALLSNFSQSSFLRHTSRWCTGSLCTGSVRILG